MSELSNFYQQMISKGIRYAYQYKITLGAGIIEAYLNEDKDFHFYAESAELPSRTIGVANVYYQGFKLNLPNNLEYGGTLNLSVLCDPEMSIRTSLEKWMNVYANGIYGGGGTKKIPTNSTVRMDLLNEKLDENTPLRTYELVGCFPTSIGNASLGQNSTETLKFSMVIQYQYYIDAKGAGTDGGEGVINSPQL